MKKLIIVFVVFIFLFLSCINNSVLKDDGIYAIFYTNMGNFICKLYYDKAPITVGNFIGLAEGTKEFNDPRTNEKIKRPFYNGLIFYGVIKDKIIQGGCPIGNGNGGPGYKFVDEFDETLKHDSEGILSMSNNGYPNSNGSRFYIALLPLPFLDGKNTVFGKVISNIDILNKISSVRVDDNYKPYNDIFIKKVKIVRKGEKAKAFNADEAFKKNEEALIKYNMEKENKKLELLKNLGVKEDKIISTKIGLKYYIIKNGNGKIPNRGDLIKVHYTGYLEDGTVFDSSYQRNKPFETEIGVGAVIPGWDEALLTMREGEKRILILPDYLGYGENGYLSIPPKATLIFEVELLSVTRK